MPPPPPNAPRILASRDDLMIDPYPHTHALRRRNPVGWVESLKMWWVVGYREVEAVLRDPANFVTGTPDSLLFETFGEHMLTLDGHEQERQKAPFRRSFAPASLRQTMEGRIAGIVDELIDTFAQDGRVELRAAFASRLPVLAILDLFGFLRKEEPLLRRLYDGFEMALSNFTWEADIRAQASADVAVFHRLLQDHIDQLRSAEGGGPIAAIVSDRSNEALSDDEIRRNLSIIFFGGISTVEALVLNAMHALGRDVALQRRVSGNPLLLPKVIEETMRWTSPVQSATRHVVRPITLAGVDLRPGDIVNCILAAANRDPAVFADPDRFDIDRPNLKAHLGFATGTHFCLGSHFAKLQAQVAIARLLERLPNADLKDAAGVEVLGFEFRQPRALDFVWTL
jgi:cytochrome P450